MTPHPITALLHAWSGGDEDALAIVTPLVHAELRQMARRHLRGEPVAHSLQVTGLVNECYLRLVDLQRVRWNDRAHFLGWSSRLMRRILVDFARERQAAKRGAGVQHVTLDEQHMAQVTERDLVALDDALSALARILTTTSRSPGVGSSTSSTLRTSSPPNSWNRTAFNLSTSPRTTCAPFMSDFHGAVKLVLHRCLPLFDTSPNV